MKNLRQIEAEFKGNFWRTVIDDLTYPADLTSLIEVLANLSAILTVQDPCILACEKFMKN